VTITQSGGDLTVTVEGLWYRTIFWEVKLLALISELYYLMTGQQPVSEYDLWAYEKAETLHKHDATFIEFGTRRRFSQKVQERVLRALIKGGKTSLMGTSNIDLARRYDLTPVGTHAHEWVMAHAGMSGYRSATKEALRVWAEEFQGNLGFALTDTFTTEAFLPEFNAYYAKLFDGVRQDSGDPFTFTDRMVAHYRSLHIDPLLKQIVFSDALDVERAIRIREYSEGRIKQALFGIGTNFSNDVGVIPLNIVMKLSYIITPQQPDRRIYVVKFGDGTGKVTGLDQAVSAARFELGLTT
jgi:nicotinate phosphoribosyltransferase